MSEQELDMPLENPELIEEAARESSSAALTLQLEALRQIRDNLRSINERQNDMSRDFHNLRTDITVLKERDQRIGKLEGELTSIAAEVKAVRLDRAEQRGSFKAAGWLAQNWQFVFIMAIGVAFAMKHGMI